MFPACAGVIPSACTQVCAVTSFPRVCGGDPIKDYDNFLQKMVSPQKRGRKEIFMYFSRIELNNRRAKTLISLVSPQKIHGIVESAFFDKSKRKLWRLDDAGTKKSLYILSEEKPDLLNILQEIGFPLKAQKNIKNYDDFLQKIRCQKYRFKITVNPTHHIGESKARVSYLTTEEQKNWLIKKGEENGFKLTENSFDVSERKWQSFRKKDGKKVSFLSVTFEGMLFVIDAKKFQKLLTKGLGAEKAYGQGLMTVIPIK